MRYGTDDGLFMPTEENANPIESWRATGGYNSTTCKLKPHIRFFLSKCAVNCYTQYFSGLSCSEYKIPTKKQYQVASAILHRYNFIVVLEKLIDPKYAAAVEKYFGVPGVTNRHVPFCERASHTANKMFPLVIKHETMEKLINLNKVDIGLYKHLTDCWDDDGGNYNFTKLNTSRFVNVTEKVHYNDFVQWKKSNNSRSNNKKRKNALGGRKVTI